MSSSGDGLTTFINGDTSGDIPILSVANPVNWGRLGQTIGTSIIATLVVGVTNVIDTMGDVYSRIFGGLEAFIEGSTEPLGAGGYPTREGPGLIDVTLGTVASAYGDAFSYSAANYGVLSLPINVAIVLVTVYITSVGLQAAASRFFGGG
ncbi:hypothetical protein [Halorubrum lipolyticum]|uniref:Uncharacterized protein n=1 Tax=Halorubrum lipolyticum DSM 21995 TaxID=1227482 RepID=M0P4D3_9EURY|nr:hypothetical protein [Halorubrum lipolyticum]EMA64663.1 hypothetical protein C469_00365 [Halorubrum lipolyticum DSM 21995]